jgi:hypothetical protein
MKKLNGAFSSVGSQLAITLAPAIEEGANALKEWLTHGVNFREVVGGAVEFVGKGVSYVGYAVDAAKIAWHAMKMAALLGMEEVLGGLQRLVGAAADMADKIPGMGGKADKFRETAASIGEWREQSIDMAKADLPAAQDALAGWGKTADKISGKFAEWKKKLEDIKLKPIEPNALKKPLEDFAGMAKKAFDMREQLKTPFETFQEEFQRMKTLFDKGLIDEDVFGRGMDDITKKLESATGIKSASSKSPTALTADSSEAMSAFLKFQKGESATDPQQRIVNAMNLAAREQARQTQIQQELVRAVKDQKQVVKKF